MINNPYRAAVGLTILACLLLVWLSVGVGIIGADGDPANAMYFAVPAVGILGASLGRFRSTAMARASMSMAAVQALIGTYAVVGGLGRPWSGPAELIVLNGFFVSAFAVAAWLFRRAALRSST